MICVDNFATSTEPQRRSPLPREFLVMFQTSEGGNERTKQDSKHHWEPIAASLGGYLGKNKLRLSTVWRATNSGCDRAKAGGLLASTAATPLQTRLMIGQVQMDRNTFRATDSWLTPHAIRASSNKLALLLPLLPTALSKIILFQHPLRFVEAIRTQL